MKCSSLIIAMLSLGYAYADGTTSLASLKNQANSLQQAINQQAQNNTTGLQSLQEQLNTFQTQLARFESPDLKKFNWVTMNQSLPANAVIAAENNNQPLYLCQAAYTGDSSYGSTNQTLDPGLLTANGCVITYGGQAYLAPEYSVLTSTSTGAWVDGSKIKTASRYVPVQPLYMMANGVTAEAKASNNTDQPRPLYNQLAVIGGSENGQNVYICRVKIGGQYFVGKVSNNTCYLAAGSGEATWPSYEVLLAKKP